MSEPNRKEIEEKREKAAEVTRKACGSQLLYAEGVHDALAWVLGDEEEIDV